VLFLTASDTAAFGETAEDLMVKLFDAAKMFFQPWSRVLKTTKQQSCGISFGVNVYIFHY